MSRKKINESKKERYRTYYLKHKEKRIQYAKDKWKNEPEKIREYQIKSERIIRNSRIRYEYGITVDDYDKLVKEQDNKCAICFKEENHKQKQRLAIDHDHITNTVRGLLCHRCNVGLGLFNDSEEILLQAINYLKENGTKEGL